MEKKTDKGYVFTILDRRGRPVRYSSGNWEKHQESHPEMEGYIGQIQITISDPDLELEADNGVTYYYKRNLGDKKFKNLWLLAIVGFDKDRGIVRTAYFTSKISQDGQIIWMKPDILMRNS